MQLDFEKWHGAKNDFIIVRIDHQDDIVRGSLIRQAPALCAMDGTGIGADGILVLSKSSRDLLVADSLTIINSDGSLAATCGNGIRCAAASLLRELKNENSRELPEMLELQLTSRKVQCRFLSKGSLTQTTSPLVSVNMGTIALNKNSERSKQINEELRKVAAEFSLDQQLDDWAYADIGNEHLVIFHQQPSRQLLHKIGPRLQQSSHWDGINVHIVTELDQAAVNHSELTQKLGQRIGSYYDALVWERGAGPTSACGSGACAIAAAVYDTGFMARDEWLGVRMPGAVLLTKQRSSDDPIELAGPSELVFTGSIQI